MKKIVGGGNGGGLGGKLLLLLLFEIKNVRFYFNAFNLLSISISIAFGAFFISVLATYFLPILSSQKVNQQLDFAYQKWKYL